MKNFSFKSTLADNARNAVTRVRPSGKVAVAPIAALLIAAFSVATSGCSKSKINNPALSQSSQSQVPVTQTVSANTTPSPAPVAASQPEAGKKNSVKGPVKKLASVRTYKDADSGISFLYPRKATLVAGKNAEQDSTSKERLPMSYVASGGTTLAVVELGTSESRSGDLFLINANKELTAEQCSQFPIESNGNAEASASDSQKPALAVGSKMTFHGAEYSVLEKPTEHGAVRYYHRFIPGASADKGACYEFGMSVNAEPQQELETASSTERKDVFLKLEKILASVKISPQVKIEAVETAHVESSDKAAASSQTSETTKTFAKEESPR
ncbi:MAG TPA: hypothetical protein VM912_06665 [Terriglobales bacterium]|nr:hypothetical protein [Terriglobales bacterium]